MEKIFWGWIYRITSPSGRVYIGQTNNIRRRHYDYESGRCSAQHRLTASFQKYGFEKHQFDVLWTGMTTRSLLSVLEMEFIEEFNSCDSKKGLNVISYTSAGKHSYNREYRRINNITKLGRGRRVLTQYDLDRMKISNPVFNEEKRLEMVRRLQSEEVRAKLRKARANQVQKRGAQHHNSIAIEQLSTDGFFIKRWDCGADACRGLGISDSKIYAVCKGKRKTTGGFVFRYASR